MVSWQFDLHCSLAALTIGRGPADFVIGACFERGEARVVLHHGGTVVPALHIQLQAAGDICMLRAEGE